MCFTCHLCFLPQRIKLAKQHAWPAHSPNTMPAALPASSAQGMQAVHVAAVGPACL